MFSKPCLCSAYGDIEASVRFYSGWTWIYNDEQVDRPGQAPLVLARARRGRRDAAGVLEGRSQPQRPRNESGPSVYRSTSRAGMPRRFTGSSRRAAFRPNGRSSGMPCGSHSCQIRTATICTSRAQKMSRRRQSSLEIPDAFLDGSMTAIHYRKAELIDVPQLVHLPREGEVGGDPRMLRYLAGEHHPQKALGAPGDVDGRRRRVPDRLRRWTLNPPVRLRW